MRKFKRFKRHKIRAGHFLQNLSNNPRISLYTGSSG